MKGKLLQIPPPCFFLPSLRVFCSPQTRVGLSPTRPLVIGRCRFCLCEPRPLLWSSLILPSSCDLLPHSVFPQPPPLSFSLSLPLLLITQSRNLLIAQSRNLLIPSGAMSSCSGLTPVPRCPSVAQFAVADPDLFPLGWPRDELITSLGVTVSRYLCPQHLTHHPLSDLLFL